MSGDGRRLIGFPIQHRRNGRQFGPSLPEQERTPSCKREPSVTVGKKDRVTMRLVPRVCDHRVLPAVVGSFDGEETPIPDPSGIELTPGKLHRHSRCPFADTARAVRPA